MYSKGLYAPVAYYIAHWCLRFQHPAGCQRGSQAREEGLFSEVGQKGQVFQAEEILVLQLVHRFIDSLKYFQNALDLLLLGGIQAPRFGPHPGGAKPTENIAGA